MRLKTLNSLYEFAEEMNIEIEVLRMPNVKSISMMVDGDCYIGIDPYEIDTSADEKVKIGHELGHCVTGSFYNIHSNCDTKSRHEYRANKWSIKKLIPKEELVKALKKGITEVWELAEYFEVTEDFIKKTIEFYNNIKEMK